MIKINGIDTEDISKINGIPIEDIFKFNGVEIGSAPSGPISLTNVTVTCEQNKAFATDPLNVTLPTGAGSGDFVMIFVAVDNPSSLEFWNVPTGWTQAFSYPSSISDAQISMYYRQLGTGEPSTVDFYHNGGQTGRDASGISCIVNNIDTENPIYAIGSNNINDAQTQISLLGVNYSVDGMGIGFLGHDGGDGDPYTYSSGWTNLSQGECGSTGTDLGYAICYQNFTGSGSTGTLTMTASVIDGKMGVQFFLKQA